MISYLKGTIIYKEQDFIILNVNGVGYKVFLAPKTFKQVAGENEVEIFCSLYVREGETLELYGFLNTETLRLFNILQGISGIGPKAALALSSLGSIEQLKKAIETKDTRYFNGVKGVGQKKIQKVILELTGKLETSFQNGKVSNEDEALQGLLSLGFSPKDAKRALARIPSTITETQQRVKEALKLLGRTQR